MFSSAKLSFFKLSITSVSSFKYLRPFVSQSFRPVHNTVNFIKPSHLVNIPTTVQVISLQDIKDYLKKEIKNGIIDKYSGLHPTTQLQSFYDNLIKQTKLKVNLLEQCEDENAMKTLCMDEKFLDILDKYLELNIYQDKKPVPWETIRAEISGYLTQKQVARQPGFRW